MDGIAAKIDLRKKKYIYINGNEMVNNKSHYFNLSEKYLWQLWKTEKKLRMFESKIIRINLDQKHTSFVTK